jgi:hypothetical protein
MAISSSKPIPNYPWHKTPNSSIHLNPKVITCHYCNKRGHKAPKCCQRARDRVNGINKRTPHVSWTHVSWTNVFVSSYFMSPNLPKNFLSQVISKGTSQVTFPFDLCTIITITKIYQPLVLKCEQVGQLFPIGVDLYPTIQSLSMDSIYSSIDIIHHHMGHINITSLLHMQLNIT